MDSKHQDTGSLPDDDTSNSLHRLETPPPQYSDLAPPPPRVFAVATHENAASNRRLQVPSSVNSESHQISALEHTVSGDTDNARSSSFDPQDPATWRGSKWADIKQQWMERHQGPREPKDPRTGRGQFTGLTPEELKAKCEGYGTLLPKGQRRK